MCYILVWNFLYFLMEEHITRESYNMEWAHLELKANTATDSLRGWCTFLSKKSFICRLISHHWGPPVDHQSCQCLEKSHCMENCWSVRTSGTARHWGWTVTNLSSGTPDMFCMDCPRTACSRDCKILEDLRTVNRENRAQLFAISSRMRSRKKNPLQANNNRFKESSRLKMTRKWEISRGMYHMCLPCSYRDPLMAKTGEKILGASSVWTSPAAVMLSGQTAPQKDARHKPVGLAHCEMRFE